MQGFEFKLEAQDLGLRDLGCRCWKYGLQKTSSQTLNST